MQRLEEKFVDKLDASIGLGGKKILEIGCGKGHYTSQLANVCTEIIGLDPEEDSLAEARSINSKNAIKYVQGFAEDLPFKNDEFDVVIFSLSLHHVSEDKMNDAIGEAVRVVRNDGHVVFLEPTEEGTIFEAEIKFDAFDGDEREEKRKAHKEMTESKFLRCEEEFKDVTLFSFDSKEDFVEFMKPKKNTDKVEYFLNEKGLDLSGERRVNICRPIK
jgi:ubiquinone/menaquinone biosynthesis C-methylase UbiE